MSTSESSGPPTPSSRKTAPRRSGRSKTQPATYNLRVLSGLEKEDSTSTSSREVSTTPSLPHNAPSTLYQASNNQFNRSQNIRRLLWNREFRGYRPGDYTALSSDLKPWKWWKGASNDVIALAWSPDGTKFAAGATAQSDEYNRGNNLLLGDLVQNSLRELPDHWIPRSTNPSSVSDNRQFQSVTSVKWVGRQLYTASYDRTVKIWDVGSDSRPSCLQTLQHTSQVVVMSVSSAMPNLIASGSRHFCLWDVRENDRPKSMNLEVHRGPRQKTEIDLAPTNLTWGSTPETNRFLVGGMVQRDPDEYEVPSFGHLALWSIDESIPTARKLNRDSQNVFDVKWHPFLPRFAAATTISPNMFLPPRTRSVVSVYDIIQSGGESLVTNQFPCPALDINEVTFCPMDHNYVTASCTDGITYVWDARNPVNVLHRLQHGDSLSPLNHEYRREFTDFGVSVALWGVSMSQFVTGGSDGVLKQWDIRLSPEDVLVSNIASFDDGITSGAFSEDKSHLVIGDHGGGVRVLASGPFGNPDPARFNLIPAPSPSDDVSGVEIAKGLISSGQLYPDPTYGPVKGPRYTGPYARWARQLKNNTPSDRIGQIPLLRQYQLRQFDGPPIEDRELDEDTKRHIQNQVLIAKSRNTQSIRAAVKKRKRETSIKPEYEVECPQDPEHPLQPLASGLIPKKEKKKKLPGDKKHRKKKKRQHQSLCTIPDIEVIDLTGDSPDRSVDGSSSAVEGQEDEDYWWPDSGCVDANLRSDDDE